MEFRLTTDLATSINPTEISFNYAELSDYLQDSLAKYQNMVVVESELPAAKKARADVNRLRDAINSEKIRIKKLWNEPYTLFEDKVKSLLAMCDEASGNIDTQVKDFEQRKADEKLDELKIAFSSMSNDIQDFISFEQIYDKRWLNASIKRDNAIGDMEAAVGRCRNELQAIRALDSPYAAELLEYYATTHDLAGALNKDASLRARAQAEKERREKQEAEMSAFVAPPIAPLVQQEQSAPGAVTQDAAPPEEKQYTLKFEITTTRDKLCALKEFFASTHISYKKIV